jgi:hypothetical protein
MDKLRLLELGQLMLCAFTLSLWLLIGLYHFYHRRRVDRLEARIVELEREPVILPFPKPDELRSYD